MILFAIYAVVVWWMAMRHRRTLPGFVIAATCAVPVLLAARFVPALSSLGFSAGAAPPTPGRGLEGVQILLFAEGIVVSGVALFIACLPRPPRGRHCGYCWYDLSGLDGEIDVCPECGTPRHGYARGKRREEPQMGTETHRSEIRRLDADSRG